MILRPECKINNFLVHENKLFICSNKCIKILDAETRGCIKNIMVEDPVLDVFPYSKGIVISSHKGISNYDYCTENASKIFDKTGISSFFVHSEFLFFFTQSQLIITDINRNMSYEYVTNNIGVCVYSKVENNFGYVGFENGMILMFDLESIEEVALSDKRQFTVESSFNEHQEFSYTIRFKGILKSSDQTVSNSKEASIFQSKNFCIFLNRNTKCLYNFKNNILNFFITSNWTFVTLFDSNICMIDNDGNLLHSKILKYKARKSVFWLGYIVLIDDGDFLVILNTALEILYTEYLYDRVCNIQVNDRFLYIGYEFGRIEKIDSLKMFVF